MKTIDIAMVAWPRTAERVGYMAASLKSIRQFVTAPGFKIQTRVSAETVDVPAEFYARTNSICRDMGIECRWRAKSPSLGGNQNDALMMGYGDFILLTQDDWEWQQPVDISRDCEFLDKGHQFAFVRYATFYTEFDAGLPRDDGTSICSVKMSGPYPYGDQPHLRRKDFATRKSQTGGAAIGFYADPGSEAGDLNYSQPENAMAEHLVMNGWQIAAYSPNVVAHNGSLSTDPARHPVPA